MSCSDLKYEDILHQVREELNKEKVKLWLEPYYDVENGVGNEQDLALQVLCQQLTEKLNIDEVLCISALRELQNHALERLKSNQVFKETGVACLRIKISGEILRNLTVNILLTSTTGQLIEEIGGQIDLPAERIKLISSGKVLKPSETLKDQGIKNGAQLMAVILAADLDKFQEGEKRLKLLESTKKDVKLLAGRSNANNDYYLQVENQAGEALNLPYHERKALVTAMTLHEKGRAALKKDDYPMALLLFLEADKEYNECTSELLKTVDNYALLHLDIAWCYLCLRNPAQIPDAERRLSLCEQSFHRSYGANLERLIAIKGTTGNEAALFMRLHLLQGVVLFHQNKRVEAKALFERAQQELNNLRVDDNSLCLLMELNYTSSEARLALRSTQGNVELAEEFIHQRRKEKEAARERNRLKLQNERESIALGMCADKKQYVNAQLLRQMEAMGFDRRQSISALKMSNNVISEAVSLVQDQPHLLTSCSYSVSDETVAQVVSLGLSPEMAQEALLKYPEMENAVRALNSLSRGNTTAYNTAMTLLDEFKKKRKIHEEEEEKAFERVSEDLIGSDLAEDHLDLNLAQEEKFLIEYLSLLN